MEKVENIVDLLSGYESYSTAEEVNLSAAADAPATSPSCAATAGASWLTGLSVGKTIDETC